MDFRKLAHEVQPGVVEFRRDLHMHPEASLQEFRTTDRVAEELDKLGISYRRLDPTGIVAEIQGGKPGKTVALRGDMDALSLTEKTDLPYKSQNDGFMHACGHDSHTSMLLGAAKVLNQVKDELCGNVRFLFQPAEEIGKGAQLVIAQGGLEGVDCAFGMHIGAMRPVGQIGGVKGASAAATDVLKITITGKGCHGAYPHTGVDAVVCGSALVMNLQTMVSREFSPMDPLVVTIGSFHAGSRFNIIAGEAVLEGTIRSFSREVHAAIPGVLQRICEKTAEAYRCTVKVEYDSITEVLVNDDAMLDLAMNAARKVAASPEDVIYGEKAMGGEDFAYYTACCPRAFLNLGTGGEYPGHSDHLTLDESAFETGVALYCQVAYDALNQ